jgi:hypothetical protein
LAKKGVLIVELQKDHAEGEHRIEAAPSRWRSCCLPVAGYRVGAVVEVLPLVDASCRRKRLADGVHFLYQEAGEAD